MSDPTERLKSAEDGAYLPDQTSIRANIEAGHTAGLRTNRHRPSLGAKVTGVAVAMALAGAVVFLTWAGVNGKFSAGQGGVPGIDASEVDTGMEGCPCPEVDTNDGPAGEGAEPCPCEPTDPSEPVAVEQPVAKLSFTLTSEHEDQLMPTVTLYENGEALLSQPWHSSHGLFGTGRFERSGDTLAVSQDFNVVTFTVAADGCVLTLELSNLPYSEAGSVYTCESGADAASQFWAAAETLDTIDAPWLAHGGLLVTAAMPPSQGSDGTWWIPRPEQITSDSTSINIMVTRTGCASGHTGEIMEPVVSMGVSDIIIRTDVAPLKTGDGAHGYVCPGNDSVAVTVDLPEPIGERVLLDAICLDGPDIDYADCMDGPIRWSPWLGL